MKPAETASTVGPGVHRRNHRRYRYQKVLDSRKQPIRGLWKRNDRFLARITVESPEGKKLVCWKLLEEAKTVAEAQAAFRKLLTEREQGKPIAIKRAPKFKDTVQRYQEHHAKLGHAKRGATLAKEKASLDLWIKHMGEIRTD